MSFRAYGKHRKQSWIDEFSRRKQWSALGEGDRSNVLDESTDTDLEKPGPEYSQSLDHKPEAEEVSPEQIIEDSEQIFSPKEASEFIHDRDQNSHKTDLKRTRSTSPKKLRAYLPKKLKSDESQNVISSAPKTLGPPASITEKAPPPIEKIQQPQPQPQPYQHSLLQSPSRLSKQESDAWGFFDDIVTQSPTKNSKILAMDVDLNAVESDHHTSSPDHTSSISLRRTTSSTESSNQNKKLSENSLGLRTFGSSSESLSRDIVLSTSSNTTLSSISSVGSPPSRNAKRISSQVSVKRTYGSANRRYLPLEDDLGDNEIESNPKSLRNGRLNLEFGPLIYSDVNDRESELSDDDKVDLKNFDELRAHGVNTHFINDVQFIIESIQEGCNNNNLSLQRSSLLQLASKSLDRDFIIGFKSTNFPVILLSEMKNNREDDYTSFLFGVILCRLLEEGGVGIGSLIAQNTWIIDFLVSMLVDQEDILKKDRSRDENMGDESKGLQKQARLKKSLMGKKKKSSPFQTSLIKFVENMDSSLSISSQSLVALSAFISLEKLGPRIVQTVLDGLVDHVDDFLLISQDLMDKLFFNEGKGDNDDKLIIDYQLQLLYLVMVQLEFLADGDETGSVLKNINRDKDKLPPIIYALTLSERYMKRKEDESGIICRLKNFTVATLRILISLTSNALPDNEQVKQIYDGGLAEGLVSFISNRKSSSRKSGEPDDDIYLYASGLLVNLVDGNNSQHICSMLLRDRNVLLNLKNSSLNSVENWNSSSKTEIHIKGCEYLALGLLATNQSIESNREEYFSENEINLIKKGLEEFENKLGNKFGYGLHNQISNVLSQL